MTPPPELSAPPELKLSYLRHLVGNLSGLVHIRSREIFKSRLSGHQLTPKQAVVLEFIANNPGVSQKEITQGVVTTPAMLVSVLDTLSERGLVKRVTDKVDRRCTCVQLTPEGVLALQAIKDSFMQVEDILQREAGLTDQEWQTLVTLLRKITEREEYGLRPPCRRMRGEPGPGSRAAAQREQEYQTVSA